MIQINLISIGGPKPHSTQSRMDNGSISLSNIPLPGDIIRIDQPDGLTEYEVIKRIFNCNNTISLLIRWRPKAEFIDVNDMWAKFQHDFLYVI